MSARKVLSAQPRRSLRYCGFVIGGQYHRTDAEDAEVAQRVDSNNAWQLVIHRRCSSEQLHSICLTWPNLPALAAS